MYLFTVIQSSKFHYRLVYHAQEELVNIIIQDTLHFTVHTFTIKVKIFTILLL